MKTHEQTRLMRQDNELRELRAENERLKDKLLVVRTAFKDVLLLIADRLPYSMAVQIKKAANEIDV